MLLPPEILTSILLYLSDRALSVFASVSKFTLDQVENDKLWRIKYEHRFGSCLTYLPYRIQYFIDHHLQHYNHNHPKQIIVPGIRLVEGGDQCLVKEYPQRILLKIIIGTTSDGLSTVMTFVSLTRISNSVYYEVSIMGLNYTLNLYPPNYIRNLYVPCPYGVVTDNKIEYCTDVREIFLYLKDAHTSLYDPSESLPS